jgi:membrane associated rhomboid family serine protease
MTTLLIAANLAVFVYQVVLALDSSRALDAFVREFALVPRRLLTGYADERQWLTVFTSMFLHGGVAHVLGNCWFLWVFGRNVEARLGSFKLLIFYLLFGVAAAALQVAMNADSVLPMLGASGAISGVLGAYFVLFPSAWVYTLVPWFVPIIPFPAILFLFVWFAIQAANGIGTLLNGTDARGGVAWWAHAGGFIAGVLLTLWAKRAGWVRRR